MRADDVANPSYWPDLFSRVEALAGSGQLSRQHGSRIESLREHTKRLQAGEGTDDDWQAIIKTVDELVGDGVPPSNREIRELLLPLIDDIPDRDDLPDWFPPDSARDRSSFLAAAAIHSQVARSHMRCSPEVKEAARRLWAAAAHCADRRKPSTRSAGVAEEDAWAFGADLDRDQRTPGRGDIRAFDRAPGCCTGLAGHPLVEPRVRRGEAVLRAIQQAARASSRRLPQPQPGCCPDPLAM